MSDAAVAASGLAAEVTGSIDAEVRLLAAVAYGEGSTADVEEELAGIAHAVTNRCKAWRKTVSEVIRIDTGYTYAADGSCTRFNLLKAASLAEINKHGGMRIAINAARQALAGEGSDPSNDAYWWDGYDLKDRKQSNMRILHGFKYGDPSHNIFGMEPILKPVTAYWQAVNKKTGKTVDTKVRGSYDCIYVSKAAHGGTIFWRYNPDYVKASGAKEYK
jgi:hypothetical protein